MGCGRAVSRVQSRAGRSLLFGGSVAYGDSAKQVESSVVREGADVAICMLNARSDMSPHVFPLRRLFYTRADSCVRQAAVGRQHEPAC